MGLRQKLWSNTLIRTLTYVIIATLVLFILLTLWLKVYTNHGQKLILPDYTGMLYKDALDLAKQNDFELIIDDSVHIVGKPGGEILRQNPQAESGVKEGRKVYITVTKHNADVFMSAQLPELYGSRFDLKASELSTLFKLDCRIIGYQYDPGPVDHILEVRYKGKPIENKKGRNRKVEIARGDILEFILSNKEGGKFRVPDLVCQTVEAAKFKATSSKMKVGEMTATGEITDPATAYVISQNPPADGSKIPMGSVIQVTIAQERPDDCQ